MHLAAIDCFICPFRIAILQPSLMHEALVSIVAPVLLLRWRVPIVKLPVIIPTTIFGYNLDRAGVAVFGIQPASQHRDL